MGIYRAFDKAFCRLGYIAGSYRARRLLGHVGGNSMIHHSVKYNKPCNIHVGDECEIRQNCTMDARGGDIPSICLGDRVRIKDSVAMCAYGGTIQIGTDVLIGRMSTILGHGSVTICGDSMLGPYSMVLSVEHIYYMGKRPFQELGFIRAEVKIGKNVYIGGHSSILAGSIIHDNVVVGAGSVVKGELLGGWMYAGVPAKPIKKIEHEEPKNLVVSHRNWGLMD